MKNYSQRKTVIFDLDGVIVNTEPIHFKAYQEAFSLKGLTLTEQDYNHKLRSKGRKQGLEILISGDRQPLRDAVAREKDRLFNHFLETERIPTFDDAISLFELCKKQGSLLGVGTASKLGDIVLSQIELISFFQVVVTGRDITHNKPNPEIYNHCCKRLNANKDHTVVIEDSETGIIAGLRAGLKVIYIKREGAPTISNEYINHPRVLTVSSLKDELVTRYLFGEATGASQFTC